MNIRYLIERKISFLLVLLILWVVPGQSILGILGIDPYKTDLGIKRNDSYGCPPSHGCDYGSIYREFDGRCNNLNHCVWGAAQTAFRRFLKSQYDDGVKEPRGKLKSPTRPVLPTPRQVSAALSKISVNECDGRLSVLNMEWGQFISHDITSTSSAGGFSCCSSTGSAVDPECLPLDVNGDPFYNQFNITCLPMTRSVPAGSNCIQGCREQVNDMSAYIDGSLVYGLSSEIAKNLRTFNKGQMKTSVETEVINGQCPVSSSCPYSFLPTFSIGNEKDILTGDHRASQQPALLSMHTLFIRVHNDLALRLSKIHTDYNDEKLYQESRRIVIALIQHITYNEYIPSLLSDEALILYCLRPQQSGYFRAYDNTLDASIHNGFSAAAFRFGHSQIPNSLFVNNGNISMVESFFNIDITFKAGYYPSDFLNGISSQKAPVVDHNLVESVSNRLFASGPSFKHGSDLFSRNIMRGRDHGLPPYNAWRIFCHLPVIITFSQMKFIMKEEVVNAFETLYKSVDEIDLFPAAISEKPLSNGALGPTLSCLLGKQFHNLKFGDRFYYEGISQPRIFTEEQLSLIRRTTIAAVLCRYTNINEVPLKAMRYSDSDRTKTKCSDILKYTVMSELERF